MSLYRISRHLVLFAVLAFFANTQSANAGLVSVDVPLTLGAGTVSFVSPLTGNTVPINYSLTSTSGSLTGITPFNSVTLAFTSFGAGATDETFDGIDFSLANFGGFDLVSVNGGAATSLPPTGVLGTSLTLLAVPNGSMMTTNFDIGSLTLNVAVPETSTYVMFGLFGLIGVAGSKLGRRLSS